MESEGRNVYHVTTVRALYCILYVLEFELVNIAEYSGPATGRLRKHCGPAAGGLRKYCGPAADPLRTRCGPTADATPECTPGPP